ncbi:Protein of unknown function [Pyronema omphalodes CBS 100304]|uniref:Uncharacterized protein n=1 Tax=Pyronema omphalodes (strain CBS 100304) TaxID=1076935 RepID=U4LDT4_PYROM|nr:Protein of unknown function [Pyronema omphalodes CBS 100304]
MSLMKARFLSEQDLPPRYPVFPKRFVYFLY